MTYVLLIYRTAASAGSIGDTAASNALAGHRAVQAEASARGELHAVARLGDAARAITVRHVRGAHEVESAALALATAIGLSTVEIAASFAVAPRTMERRLTRARQRLRERGDPDGAPPGAARDRLDAVLRTLHLLFNEGYWSTSDESPIRAELCRLSLGLARSLRAAYPDEGEVTGLLCVMQLHDARRAARLDDHGTPIPLPDQDRSRYARDRRGRDDARGRAGGEARRAVLARSCDLGAPCPRSERGGH